MIKIKEEFGGWPSRDCKAVLTTPLKVDEFARRLGSPIERAKDNLDWFTVTYFDLAGVGPVIIQHYDNDPVGHSIITIDSVSNTLKSENNLIDALSLKMSDVAWRLSDQDSSSDVLDSH